MPQNRPRRNRLLPAALLPALAALPACGPIVQLGLPSGPPPAQHVLAEAPAAAPGSSPGVVDPKTAVTLLAATAPAMLQTTRIPVRVGATEVRYIVGHAWTEPPVRLFMQMLEARLAAEGVPLVDRRITGRSAAHVLGGELLEFGVDERGPMVRIRFEATLTGPNGIRRQGFSREAPIGRIDGPTAAAALSAASAELGAEIARWVAGATRAERQP
ncbi:ABC-type transport auxiliary lipoprotein family protein [Thermaurantiacus sp.]